MGRKKYNKIKRFRIHIKKKFIIPFLRSLMDLIYRLYDKFRDKIFSKIIHLESEYTRDKCSKVECSICGKKDWPKRMSEIFNDSGGHYYCQDKNCQERFIEDAGDPPLDPPFDEDDIPF